MILVIDNYDSFVANLARYCVLAGQKVRILRNDAPELSELDVKTCKALLLSPGPCAPDQAGLSKALIAQLSGKVPILGICLGHQCIGAVFGGKVGRAYRPMHGRAALVRHDGTGLFSGLPNPLSAGRYHSLIVTLPGNTPLLATAWSEEGEIMALRHKDHPTYGVQFHPESILTPEGLPLLKNFFRQNGL